MIVSMLVAADEKNGIGLNNKLPWHLPADLKYFKRLTLDHHILMGRKTFESIGKPLPERVNVVLTVNKDYVQAGTITVNSLEEGITLARDAGETELFVIGGAGVFKEAARYAHKLYLTRIHHAFEADVFLPFDVEKSWKRASADSFPADEKNKWPYTFEVYDLKPLTMEAGS